MKENFEKEEFSQNQSVVNAKITPISQSLENFALKNSNYAQFSKRILIDTNAMMGIAEYKIDIFRELERICDFNYEICVLEGTIRELERIMKEQRLRFKLTAKLAIALLKAKKVKILLSEGFVDDLLVAYSQQGEVVLTQDMALKKRLKRPYLTIRGKKYVVRVE